MPKELPIYSFTQEHELETCQYPEKITTFWQQGSFDHFFSKDNTKLCYATFISPKYEKDLVIVSGRIEAYLKYQELCFDLFQQGYNIYILDHRGQGLSDRLIENSHKGYVEVFDDYVDDLELFVKQIVQQKYQVNQAYLLAHSMGGAISLRYLQRSPQAIKAAVVASPMIAVNTGAIPKKLTTKVLSITQKINKLFKRKHPYFWGQGNYKNIPFQINHLTHSKPRYQIFRKLYQQHPKIQLGGVTVHWLEQATQVEQQLLEQVENISVPVLILQAGKDNVVDNQAQQNFYRKLTEKKPNLATKISIIDGAWHELFFEQDKFRTTALQQTLAWFSRY